MRVLVPVALLALSLGTACPLPQTPGLHVQNINIANGVPVADAVIMGERTLCVIDTGDSGIWLSPAFGGQVWHGLTEPEYLEISITGVPDEWGNPTGFAGWNFAAWAVTRDQDHFDEWERVTGLDGIDCWLGNGMFAQTRMTLDYAGQRLELADVNDRIIAPEGLTGDEIELVPLYDEFLMVGSVDVAGDYDGIFLFDSGAGYVTLSPSAYEDIGDPPELSGEAVIGDQLQPTGRLPSLAVSDSAVTDVSFVTWDDPQLRVLEDYVGLRVDGTVGASFLAGYAVTWDFPNQRMILRPYEDEVRDVVLGQLQLDLGF